MDSIAILKTFYSAAGKVRLVLYITTEFGISLSKLFSRHQITVQPLEKARELVCRTVLTEFQKDDYIAINFPKEFF